jgi:hypothetical protein
MDALQTGPVFVGLDNIGRAFQRSRWTIRRWIANEGFPAARLPNDEWVTTQTLIDQWVQERARKRGKGCNA